MTWYAVNGESRQLICAWPSGRGYLARTVARWRSSDSQSPVSLADKLSSFSDQLWSCYASAGATEPDCEAPQPALDDAFALIGQRQPAPTWLCRDAMLDATAQLAATMDRTTQGSVRAAVTKDIGEEIDAVARARAGDLTGRASIDFLGHRGRSRQLVLVECAQNRLRSDHDHLAMADDLTRRADGVLQLIAAHYRTIANTWTRSDSGSRPRIGDTSRISMQSRSRPVSTR